METPTPLMIALAGMYPVNDECIAAMRTLPPCTMYDAMVLAVGEPHTVEALLQRKPHLRPIEDFIQTYIW